MWGWGWGVGVHVCVCTVFIRIEARASISFVTSLTRPLNGASLYFVALVCACNGGHSRSNNGLLSNVASSQGFSCNILYENKVLLEAITCM